MTKKKLQQLLIILMTGSRTEFKLAKKEISTLWHCDTEGFKIGALVALEFLPRFDQIKTDLNKEAFAAGLSFFFLALGDDHFDILKNFTLRVMQHPNGHIREAIRHTSSWLFCSLASRAHPFVYPPGQELTTKQKTEQVKAREQYLNYVKEIESLIDKYSLEDEKVKYIEDMKPSVNKSLQQLWSGLTDSRAYQEIIAETRPIPSKVFFKRKELEQEITKLLKETKSDFDLADVKDMIFREEDNDDMMKIMAMFDHGDDISKLSNILELTTYAWNYFPHQILGGLSPAEMSGYQ
ncbi:MAG: hypothetical protein NTV48_03735 [Candidatus Vogelbacteria bacterium]|nr:hypothetical protein [Candidatus Vogelbacteria bacterium]